MKNIEYVRKALDVEPRILAADVELSAVMDLEDDTAYISGSIVEGFGNAASDVDIYIITDKNPLLPEGIKFGYTNSESGYYNEVIVYHKNYVREICEMINSGIYDIDAYDFLEHMEFYYRCAIGIPLLNEDRFKELTMDFSKEKANQAYGKYYSKQSRRMLGTIKGLQRLGLYNIAYFFAQKAMKYAVDYWLATRGEGYESDKFRFMKLERVCKDECGLYEELWRLQSKGEEACETYIENVIKACEKLGVNLDEADNSDVTYNLNGAITHVKLVDEYIIFKGNYVYKANWLHKWVIENIVNGITTHEKIVEMYTQKCEFGNVNLLLDTIYELCSIGIITIL